MAKALDITNKVFGRLTAIKRVGNTKYNKSVWLVECSCGNNLEVVASGMVSGNTTSCGCYKAEVTKQANTTHGMSKTSEYRAWADMNKRCSSHSQDRCDYYDRGITVHEDFSTNFSTWLQEMGMKPSKDKKWSVGRVNNNLGYTYGNIRWELADQQAQNHSKQKNNKSGITGVRYSDKESAWVAQWKPINSRARTKNFSAKKYGYEGAKQLAISHRINMIVELNSNGANYAPSHGADK